MRDAFQFQFLSGIRSSPTDYGFPIQSFPFISFNSFQELEVLQRGLLRWYRDDQYEFQFLSGIRSSPTQNEARSYELYLVI